MTAIYFPGANTPQGFFNRFDCVLDDPRVRHRVYIKGGAGCGKSTLMRQLAGAAEAAGADVELGLCSSDPDSLDLLFIPQAGLAVCDATAPHVCEPSLCGVDGSYLNLGRFYRIAELEARRPHLKSLQKENQACYGCVYACLQSAQTMYLLRERLVLDEAVEKRVRAAALSAATPLLEAGGGRTRKLFLTGITPTGCMAHYSALQPASTIYLLQDSYHLAGIYLQQILDAAEAAGVEVLAGYHPLFPGSAPEQLYLPQSGVAFVRQSSHFPCELPQVQLVDLNELVPPARQERAAAAQAKGLTSQILGEAVRHLRQAKEIHDELERQLHPYVDFAGVSRTTERCREALIQLLQK